MEAVTITIHIQLSVDAIVSFLSMFTFRVAHQLQRHYSMVSFSCSESRGETARLFSGAIFSFPSFRNLAHFFD